MKFVKNFLTLCGLVALFSQGAFAQMPGTFTPMASVSAAGGALDCIGGNVTYANGQTIHSFTSVGSNDLLCSSPHLVNYLVVAGGGGGGGASYSGGGGAGGMLTGTATLPIGTSNVTVGAGGPGGISGQRGTNGGNSSISVPGGAGSFFPILPTQTLAPGGSGFNAYEMRTRWNASVYTGSAPATGTQIRVTVGYGIAGSNTFTGIWCGHAGPASPSLNYNGSQVPILFSGSASGTVPTTTLVSDPVNFSFNKSSDFICSVNWTGSQAIYTTTGPVGVFSTYAGGTYPSAGNTTFGSNGTANYWYGSITQVEVLTNQTIVANAIGGGGGGQYSTFVIGNPGGSGGGSGYGGTAGGAGTAGQGNAGGIPAASGCGTGGGGAGAAGAACTSPNGSVGGAGLQSSITGAPVWYAAGGGGGPYTGTGGLGGSGIGGNGGNYSPATSCTAGAKNTGSGGGGIASTGICAGGDGIVVVSYPSGIPNPNCVGGTVTTVGAYTVHTFLSSGAISCATGKSLTFLVVAGGGGGGSYTGNQIGGGGGAGGYLTGTGSYLPPGASTVIVGAGGTATYPTTGSGTNGGGSTLPGVSATGGGAGTGYAIGKGLDGGSGGGAGDGGSSTYVGGNPVAGQGNKGGDAVAVLASGGGGGCGAPGQNATVATNGGNGGAGCTWSFDGVTRAGGGGGAVRSGTAGIGGTGGGGNVSVAGAPNTGSGGGASAAGGSGIIVVGYLTGSTQPPPPCVPNTDGGGTFANVVALWHFDNSLADSSGKGHTGTIVGTGSLSAVQSKFGGYSYYNGTGAGANYVSTPGHTDFNMRTGDFTIEGWFYNTVNGGAGIWGSSNTSNGGDWSNFFQNATLAQAYWGTTSYAPSWTYTRPLNTWYHLAIVRQGGTGRLFINGTEVTPSVSGQVGDINPGLTDAKVIGIYAATSGWAWPGYIDEFRVSNIARYTSNFSPQIQAFCNN